MALGLTLLSVVRSFVHRRISWTHAAHWVMAQGLPYDGAEFADAYGAEWARQERATALRDLSFDVIPGPTQISERPMKQFAKYHVFGWVDIWDRSQQKVIPVATHLYTDRLMTIAEYNEALIQMWEDQRAVVGATEPSRIDLIVRARVDMIEHNQDWDW